MHVDAIGRKMGTHCSKQMGISKMGQSSHEQICPNPLVIKSHVHKGLHLLMQAKFGRDFCARLG